MPGHGLRVPVAVHAHQVAPSAQGRVLGPGAGGAAEQEVVARSGDAVLESGRGVGQAVSRAGALPRAVRSGARSASSVSSNSSGAAPRQTRAGLQPRLSASWTPVFIPCPPAGLWMYAASPARKNGPSVRVRWGPRPPPARPGVPS